jgi:hypothetical protein
MELRDFDNRIRILNGIDIHELADAGVDTTIWPAFRADPHLFFIRCDDDAKEKIWKIIQRRAANVHRRARKAT